MNVQMWLTIVAVGLFAFNVWLYYRSAPGASDRYSASLGMMVTAAMVIGLAPQWLFPHAPRIRVAASIVSILISLSTIAISVRRLRTSR